MIRYIVEITQGDEYNHKGDCFYISESEIEKIKKEGYRIFEHTCGPDGAQIYYPCKIFKREYKMIDEINVGSSSISNIKTKYCEDNDTNWWMDHWC